MWPWPATLLCGISLCIGDAVVRTQLGLRATSCKMQIGLELAEILAGAWRQPSLRKPAFSREDLDRLAPLLTAGGGAALTWFGIRGHRAKFSESVLNLY